MTRFHQHHYAPSLAIFTVSVMLCALLNLQSPFAVQFMTMFVFVVGLLLGGRLPAAINEWPAAAA
jgi:hypothetical protein